MPLQTKTSTASPAQRYTAVRARTAQLIEGLSEADCTVQSMPDASPAKWHLAHTTWFFETFLLRQADASRAPFHAAYPLLFNSYYEAAGPRWSRPQRGLLTRPSLGEVLCWREQVDALVLADLQAGRYDADQLAMLTLGLAHEQQHQELMLTDLLHLFALNPLRPVVRALDSPAANRPVAAAPLAWSAFDGGIVEIGAAEADSFSFDCEGPRHAVLLRPFKLAHRPVSNAEWLAFMADGGYRNPLLWKSDGWAACCEQGWQAPLYWEHADDAASGWRTMSLHGLREIDAHAPVAHISWYEADAYATWVGKRLPLEAEWEHVAQAHEADEMAHAQWADAGVWVPQPAAPSAGLAQLFGTVWEWTASTYSPYPGFRPAPGAVGEYNGKFMTGQYVLRGGSCLTPAGHVRASYRNFFHPDKRWQSAGLRLADDA